MRRRSRRIWNVIAFGWNNTTRRERVEKILAAAEAFRPETSSAALLISHLLSQQGLGIILRTAVQPLFALEASILRRQGVCCCRVKYIRDVIRAAARASPNAAVAGNYLFANLILRPLTIWRSLCVRLRRFGGARQNGATFMCCELICMRLEYAIRRRHSFLKTCTGQVGVINTSLFGFGIVANRRHGTGSQPRNANYPPPRALRDAKTLLWLLVSARVSYFLALGCSPESTEVIQVAKARFKYFLHEFNYKYILLSVVLLMFWIRLYFRSLKWV